MWESYFTVVKQDVVRLSGESRFITLNPVLPCEIGYTVRITIFIRELRFSLYILFHSGEAGFTYENGTFLW